MARITAALLVLIAIDNSCSAQKAPELGYVFPPAIQKGTTKNVQLGGFDFTPDMQFFVYDSAVKLETEGQPGSFLVPEPPYWFGEKSRLTAFPIPREIPATLSVPSEVPAGILRWQIANANGCSGLGRILISDIREIVEQRDRDRPILLPAFPLGVSGRLARIAEVDQYELVLPKKGLVTIELQARSLGTDLNAVIEVFDDEDRLVVDTADTSGRDLIITFLAEKGKRYNVKLYDLDYRGHMAMVYRMAFHQGPGIWATSPACLTAGLKQEIELIGYGVASGQPRLERTKMTVDATRTKAGQKLSVVNSGKFGISPALLIPVIPRGVQNWTLNHEVKPNAVFEFEAKKGESFRIDARSLTRGTPIDPCLKLVDADKKTLVENDDLPGSTDAGVFWTASKDGPIRCLVSNVSGSETDISSIGWLSVNRLRPDFRLSGSQAIHLPAEGEVVYPVTATRVGGHTHPIHLEVIGLPKGVKVKEKTSIESGKNAAKITLVCSKGQPVMAYPIQIVGHSRTLDSKAVESKISRRLMAVDSSSRIPGAQATDRTEQLLLSMTMKPTFSVELVDKNRQRAVHRGTTYPAPFRIKREDGFEGKIELVMASRQGRHRQGITAPLVQVAPSREFVQFPCFMPEWLETDRTTRMVVLGRAWQPDPTGRLRCVTKPANARITMILEGALLRISNRAKEIRVIPGEKFQLPLRLDRSPKLEGSVKLELIAPEPIRDLIAFSEPSPSFSADQVAVSCNVITKSDPKLKGLWKLTVRASAMIDEKWPVVSQNELEVEFVSSGIGVPSK